MQGALGTVVVLLKLRIGAAVALGALAGMLAAGQAVPAGQALAFTLAVLGASAAAGGFNHYHERESDRLMRRTRRRPFADGTLRPGPVWPAAFLGLLAASLLLAYVSGGGVASLLVFLGALTYGVVYTIWLKRRTAWNIVIGGAAGSFAVLAGAAAVAPGIGWAPAILAVVLFLWTPPHFWALAAARQEDYRHAGIPMLPVQVPPRVWAPVIFAHTLALALLSLLPLWHGLGPAYGMLAGAGGAYFTWRAAQLWREPSPVRAIATFRASLLQFTLLAGGVVLDAVLR
jgi:protoheme IX farnesyltransferase